MPSLFINGDNAFFGRNRWVIIFYRKQSDNKKCHPGKVSVIGSISITKKPSPGGNQAVSTVHLSDYEKTAW